MTLEALSGDIEQIGGPDGARETGASRPDRLARGATSSAAPRPQVGSAPVFMSIDFTVYLPRGAMPAPRAWAEAIADSGFPAELTADFDVDEFSGFLPCRFDGVDAGFEYSSGPIEFIDELELPAEFDFSVTFTTHSSMRELAASAVCAAVLCAVTHGTLVDPQGDLTISSNEAISWARDQLEEIDL